MVEWTWQKIGAAVLAVLGGIFIITWAFGGFGPVKETVSDIIGFIDQFIGAEEIQAETPAIPAEHQGVLRALQQTVQEMLQTPETRQTQLAAGCFANYKQFPPLARDEPYGGLPRLGEGSTQQVSFEMRFDDGGTADDRSDDKTEVLVRGGAGGRQDIPDESFVLEGVRPCVIADVNDGAAVAGRFFHHFIGFNPQLPVESPLPMGFTPVDAIYLTWGRGSPSGNIIRWEPTNLQVTEGDNFLDGGWIYTPDFYHVCFFPTVDLQDYASEGLNDNYLGDASPSTLHYSLAWQGQRYYLNLCESLPYRMPMGNFGADIALHWFGRDDEHYVYNRDQERWEVCSQGTSCSTPLLMPRYWSPVLPCLRSSLPYFACNLEPLNEINGYDWFYQLEAGRVTAINNRDDPLSDLLYVQNLPPRVEQES